MSTLDPVQIAALDFARGKRGVGSIDPDGYRRIHLGNKKYDMEHRVVWREHNGPIPPNTHVHHRDGNKLNNEICNLELIGPIAHRRLHCGHKLIEGRWYKPCRDCLKLLTYDNFYEKPGKNGPSSHSYCKPCYNKRIIARRNRVNA